ncbi:MAG: TIM44-like domain-containing protein [Pseudolabrys sp.]|nr:TIM44-like domain-containing protein [Pseudolabrys sp.]
MKRHRWLIALAAIATIFTLAAADYADARAGRGGSAGSRGARTFSAPAATPTAPRAAQPLQRSTTQPSTAATGAAAAGQAARPGLFGGGMLGGLAAGFLGAGLFGMLFGHGFMGGMGGFASFLGLILQVVLVIVVARLAFSWWQRRNQPAYAMQGATPDTGAGRPAAGGLGGGFGGLFGGGAAASAAGEPISIDKQDYDDFERLLTDVQAAYTVEDLNALRSKATPEMVSYFAEDLADNAGRGLINKVTDVKLLQGDLAEAWREGGDEYATVAMRFELTDSMVERASGNVVEGGMPSEATELWTFRRGRGGPWMLSAIQQG